MSEHDSLLASKDSFLSSHASQGSQGTLYKGEKSAKKGLTTTTRLTLSTMLFLCAGCSLSSLWSI